MATELYFTSIDIHVTPVWHRDPPLINIIFDNKRYEYSVEHPTTYHFESLRSAGTCVLQVEFFGKQDSDTVPEQALDKAVIIDSVTVNSITHEKILLQSQYRPRYPEPWYGQQAVTPLPVLMGHNYLGWNGIWILDIEVPAFKWLHEILDLGWIYD